MLLQKPFKERGSVISALHRHTEFLDSPHLRRTLGQSTFDLADLKRRHLSVFLCLPSDRLPEYHRWIRLMVGCTLRALMRTRGRPDHRVVLLLDEFQNLGRLGPVERDMSLAAGFGVQFWLFVQDIARLRATYPNTWETFVTNSDILQAFGASNDRTTSEYLSWLTGEAAELSDRPALPRPVRSEPAVRQGVGVKRILAALIGLGLVVAQAEMLGFRFDLTRSLPLGVYRVTSAPPTRDSIVQVCLPPRVAEFARRRGYLGPGKCPGGVRPLGKMVLATEGDVVGLGPEGIHLNGEPVPNSQVVGRDSNGRTVAHHPWGTYRLGPGELWLFSDRQNAYDSRYFGPVHEDHAVAVLRPWWVR